ncbi:MAG TPA: hypothetical protein VHN80_01440, partial [Kineosporiaceae bacterium]|nr:hypothetical protein [Kineosporiaceae bacterium]
IGALRQAVMTDGGHAYRLLRTRGEPAIRRLRRHEFAERGDQRPVESLRRRIPIPLGSGRVPLGGGRGETSLTRGSGPLLFRPSPCA